jgi:hypothetical protein
MMTPTVAKAEASGQQDELVDSLAELFTNLSIMVRSDLQIPPRLESLPVSMLGIDLMRWGEFCPWNSCCNPNIESRYLNYLFTTVSDVSKFIP